MNQQQDSQTITGSGKVFAEGREALDLTREQTADILNLSVRVIRAIEESRPEQLPDSVYVNGYIRSYAKLLGLAAQPLIDAWWAPHLEKPEEPTVAELAGESRIQDQRPFKMGRWAVIAVVLSAGFVYFVTQTNSKEAAIEIASVPEATSPAQASPPAQGNGQDETAQIAASESSVVPAQPEEPQAATAEPAAASTREQAQPIQQADFDNGLARAAAASPSSESSPAPEVKEELAAPATALPADPAPQELASNASAETKVEAEEAIDTGRPEDQVSAIALPSEPRAEAALAEQDQEQEQEQERKQEQEQEQEQQREVATAFALPRLTEQGDEEIQLAFTADCWFELRSEAGVLLYADLGRAGQARRYVGEGPFRIKLGYSPGVTLSFNASEVNLLPFTRQDVANLVIGADAPSGRRPQSKPST